MLVLVPVEVPAEVNWVQVQVQAQAQALELDRWGLARPGLQQAVQLAQQVQHQ